MIRQDITPPSLSAIPPLGSRVYWKSSSGIGTGTVAEHLPHNRVRVVVELSGFGWDGAARYLIEETRHVRELRASSRECSNYISRFCADSARS